MFVVKGEELMYDAMAEDLRNDIARGAVADSAERADREALAKSPEKIVTAGPEDVVRDVDDYLPGGMIPVGQLGTIITELMRPVMASIGKILENNTAALEQLSAAQSIQNDRLEALEKQIRLQTPVSAKEAGYLNAAIRKRARELLDKREVTEEKAVKQLGNIIRKAVLQRYGTGTIREIPKHEYQVALQQIGIWNDMLEIRDVVKEARSRAENSETSGNAE